VKVQFYLIYAVIVTLILSSGNAAAQERQVIQLSGIVINDSTESLSFVHILVKNSRRGTISDKNGYFSIVAREKDTLILSSIGYKKKRFIIPEYYGNQFLWHDIKMVRDTIMLKEAIVLSWISYQTFIADVVAYSPPEDDITRAENNLAELREMIKFDYKTGVSPVDGGLNYKYTMQQRYNQLYTKGQYPSYSILNPFAWAQFFKALQNGDFRK